MWVIGGIGAYLCGHAWGPTCGTFFKVLWLDEVIVAGALGFGAVLGTRRRSLQMQGIGKPTSARREQGPVRSERKTHSLEHADAQWPCPYLAASGRLVVLLGEKHDGLCPRPAFLLQAVAVAVHPLAHRAHLERR